MFCLSSSPFFFLSLSLCIRRLYSLFGCKLFTEGISHVPILSTSFKHFYMAPLYWINVSPCKVFHHYENTLFFLFIVRMLMSARCLFTTTTQPLNNVLIDEVQIHCFRDKILYRKQTIFTYLNSDYRFQDKSLSINLFHC